MENIEAELATLNLSTIDTQTEIELAAQIGKYLLEKNNALEETLENNNQVIEKLQQEVEELLNQTHILQEANRNYLKTAEQLEANLCELERINTELVQQRATDQQLLQELNASKDFFEQRCSALEESYESIEEELNKTQQLVRSQEKERLEEQRLEMEAQKKEIKHLEHETQQHLVQPEVPEVIVQVQTATQNQNEDEMRNRIDLMTKQLAECTNQLQQYYHHMERLEVQLSNVVQRNVELEDVITSKLADVTPTSYFNSNATLLQELATSEGFNSLESFQSGNVVASTPPEIRSISLFKKAAEVIQQIDSDSSSVTEETYPVTTYSDDCPARIRVENETKRKKRLVLSKEIKNCMCEKYVESIQLHIALERANEMLQQVETHGLSFRRRVQNFVKWAIISYHKALYRGALTIMRPFVTRVQPYMGIFILWANKNWIEHRIGIV